MSQAFLLISCDLGKEGKVVKELEAIDDVKEVQQTTGVFDIIAKIESDSDKKLKETVSSKIRNIDPVRSVLILEAD
ncbi:MAG TPA: Lrp/AsnC ligand binding domain-containing protein [Nitrosopumilaceae archaeon]|nr:Lrp/AsnC ligand binding domain-containing protein [Nitrosopumilaceae archaeon]